MRKIFNKALAGFTTVALVATLLVGINVSKTVKADDTPVSLANWTFLQGGQFNDDELWNVAYINSVTMNGTNESITGWLRGDDNIMQPNDPSFNQSITANQISDGFTIDIENNSQDKDWANDRINPWTITASMKDVAIEAGHTYTVSFKAHASKKKYCYVDFAGTVVDEAGNAVSITPYEGDTVAGSNQLIALGTADQTFTYTFTNWTSVTAFTTTLNLGAFNSQFDYAGNDVSNIITSVESMWGGIVYVSNFTITDNGLNSDFVAPPAPDQPATPGNDATQTTTKAPTATNPSGGSNAPAVTTKAPTTKDPAKTTVKKLAKVKKVKAKNNKKKTLTITWKKVKNAKKYQVKVGTKTYNTKKTKLVVKKLKKGKKYTVKVRAKATGYKTGAWSKKVKVKVKK